MKSWYQQLEELCAATEAKGRQIQCLQIHPDHYDGIAAEASEAGALSDDRTTILGHPFEITDRISNENSVFSVLDSPRDAPTGAPK